MIHIMREWTDVIYLLGVALIPGGGLSLVCSRVGPGVRTIRVAPSVGGQKTSGRSAQRTLRVAAI